MVVKFYTPGLWNQTWVRLNDVEDWLEINEVNASQTV